MIEPKAQLSAEIAASGLQAEITCSDSEHRLLGHVFASITFPIYVIDVNTHRILLANPAASKNHVPQDATCYQLTHRRDTPCDGSEGACPIAEVCRTKERMITEHVHADRFGVPRHYEVHAFPLCDSAGRVTQIIEYNVDISDRKRAQQEVGTYQRWLERMVHDLRLVNEDLRETSLIAAHDLQSPLAGISMAARTLKRILPSELNERQNRTLETLIKCADRTHEMIASVYRCGQISSSQLQRAAVDLNAIVQELTSVQLRLDIEASRGTVHVPERLHAVWADEIQMLELMQNLIANGLKYHRTGIPPEITIRSHAINTGSVRLEVEDNGIGIQPSNCDKIFLMFERLDDARNREGAGIGLAVCKRIIERHGGCIGVSSTYGAGSTFWVEIASPGQAGAQSGSTPAGAGVIEPQLRHWLR